MKIIAIIILTNILGARFGHKTGTTIYLRGSSRASRQRTAFGAVPTERQEMRRGTIYN